MNKSELLEKKRSGLRICFDRRWSRSCILPVLSLGLFKSQHVSLPLLLFFCSCKSLHEVLSSQLSLSYGLDSSFLVISCAAVFALWEKVQKLTLQMLFH